MVVHACVTRYLGEVEPGEFQFKESLCKVSESLISKQGDDVHNPNYMEMKVG
jgi:hypothetical protein